MSALERTAQVPSDNNDSKQECAFRRSYMYIVLAIAAVIITIIIVSGVIVASSNDNEAKKTNKSKPNIVFIMMDDLGYTDVGYYSNYQSNNSYSYSTPNIESLAAKGIKLHSHYVEPVCSATRSAFLSGRYAWRTGLDIPEAPNAPYHTNTDFTFFSKRLSEELNYNTLMVGKWHVGYKALSMLPFNRGFDDFLFFTLGGEDYYEKVFCLEWDFYDDEALNLSQSTIDERNSLYGNETICIYDLWGDSQYVPYKEDLDVYNERIFTNKVLDYISNHDYKKDDPFFVYYAMPTPHIPILEPPNNDTTGCDHIDDDLRVTQCQMVRYADSLIGEIVDLLNEKDIMDDTLIVFASDNGPATGRGRGQTLPLRSRKGAKFEGGIKTASFISGGYVENMDLECDSYDDLFHVTDWYLTLLEIAGYDDLDGIESDGFPLWTHILSECSSDSSSSDDDDDASPRNMIISARMCHDSYYINTYVRYNGWKLVINDTTNCDGSPPRDRRSYYTFPNGQVTYIPNEAVYDEYIDNHEYGDLFLSACYDEMNVSDKNNPENFVYDDLMLFNIETDAIEACDVSDQYPEIVDNLLQILDANVRGNYFGSLTGNPAASSVLAQVESYSCEYDETYMISWSDSDCCDDDSFDDWEYVWQRAIDIKEECINSMNR